MGLISVAGSPYAAIQDDEVKNMYVFSQYYDGYGYFGVLTHFNTNEMFAVKLNGNTTSTLTVEGVPTVLPKAITLNDGWTYISCPFQEDTIVANAVDPSVVVGLPSGASITYQVDNELKSFAAFTTYYADYGWFGTLTHLQPGIGYMLKTSNGGDVTFTEARRRLEDKSVQLHDSVNSVLPKDPSPTSWKVVVGRFLTTMSITASVSVCDVMQKAGILAVFVGTDLRGVQDTAMAPPFGPFANKPIYHTVVYGEKEGEALSFHFFDGRTQITLDNALSFHADGQVGNAIEPMMLKKAKLFG
jgi:hypothetical protein